MQKPPPVSRRTLLAGLALASSAASWPLALRAQSSLLPLRIGALAADAGGQVFYAQDLGWYKAAGLDVEVSVLNNSAGVASAIVGGALDVGAASVPVTAAARLSGIPLKFVATGAIDLTANPVSLIVSASDASYRRAADLDGGVLAVNGLRDQAQISAQAWLARSGADLRSVRFIELPFAEMAAAVQAGRIAAAHLAEPFLSASRDALRDLGNAHAALGDGWLITGYVAAEDGIAKNAEAMRRFRAAMRRCAQWANAHPQESSAILAAHTKVPLAAASHMTRVHYDESATLDPRRLQTLIDAGVRFGELARPIPASDLVA